MNEIKIKSISEITDYLKADYQHAFKKAFFERFNCFTPKAEDLTALQMEWCACFKSTYGQVIDVITEIFE